MGFQVGYFSLFQYRVLLNVMEMKKISFDLTIKSFLNENLM